MKINPQNINKLEDIVREEECQQCKKGTCKLKVFLVSPKYGHLTLLYSQCSNLLCSNRKGYITFTNIAIKELALGK